MPSGSSTNGYSESRLPSVVQHSNNSNNTISKSHVHNSKRIHSKRKKNAHGKHQLPLRTHSLRENESEKVNETASARKTSARNVYNVSEFCSVNVCSPKSNACKERPSRSSSSANNRSWR
jgi:hypothetical protein